MTRTFSLYINRTTASRSRWEPVIFEANSTESVTAAHLLVAGDHAACDHPCEDAHHGFLNVLGQGPPPLDRFEGVIDKFQPELGGRGYSEPSQRGSPPLFVGAM